MASTIIVGDGPGGLSAALYLAKLKMPVTVFGTNETPMHAARLLNYLGIEDMTGTDFQNLARKQVAGFGAKLIDEKVTAVGREGQGFTVTTESGATHQADYLVLAIGFKPELAESLGLTVQKPGVVEADRNGRTAVDKVYVIGWSTRPDKIQAIISAGDGAAAALDILSREAGKDIHDFDTV